MTEALTLLGVLLVAAAGAVGLVVRRRRRAARLAADPRAAACDAICGMVRHQRKQAKGSMRGQGLGQNSGWSDPGPGF
ncbi:hypothetical protein [Asanoa iriomotensis]|uniref:LPXTG-motif cell wall-anchored protein n=1 Tax=Asanoa iriomotensis TaxID=234613 RepID=A0ABQ4CAQ8_9ACTN|nr:hypothetical protein [Asanoa iriomotensis]GIF59850.1 hypothetical protein Air01nite_59450 [Asanoa iriomotensis]